MPLSASVGHAQGLDARETASQAAFNAIAKSARKPVLTGFVIASDYFNFTQVISGARAIVGDAPLIGFSTSGELTAAGSFQKSVVVALLLGSSLQARADWWQDFGVDSLSVAQKMAAALQPGGSDSLLFIAADGFSGNAQEVCQALPAGAYSLAGILASGDLKGGRTYQAGGQQAGNGGLAAAVLQGDFAAGIAAATGWQEVGAYFTVTGVRGPWIQTLDDQPAAEVYARWLGYSPHEWTLPPLNRLARLYPLGIEMDAGAPLLIRSPLKVENDGSLRLHSPVAVGSLAHMMAGSLESCMSAIQQAVAEARQSLGNSRPLLALIFPDLAWQMLLATKPGAEAIAAHKILGDSVAVAGGYVLGQLSKTGNAAQFQNQHILVILIAAKE